MLLYGKNKCVQLYDSHSDNEMYINKPKKLAKKLKHLFLIEEKNKLTLWEFDTYHYKFDLLFLNIDLRTTVDEKLIPKFLFFTDISETSMIHVSGGMGNRVP